LAEPSSVAFQFKKRGVVVVKKTSEEKLLKLLELGAEYFEEKCDQLVFYLLPNRLEEFRQGAEKLGVEVISTDLAMLPKTWLNLTSPQELKEVSSFLEELRDHEDVQRVFSNFPDNANFVQT
jgi:transcriptional/translational regulatory protein YebC/TACO1